MKELKSQKTVISSSQFWLLIKLGIVELLKKEKSQIEYGAEVKNKLQPHLLSLRLSEN